MLASLIEFPIKLPDLNKRLDDLTDRIDTSAHLFAFFQGTLLTLAVVAVVVGALAYWRTLRK